MSGIGLIKPSIGLVCLQVSGKAPKFKRSRPLPTTRLQTHEGPWRRWSRIERRHFAPFLSRQTLNTTISPRKYTVALVTLTEEWCEIRICSGLCSPFVSPLQGRRRCGLFGVNSRVWPSPTPAQHIRLVVNLRSGAQFAFVEVCAHTRIFLLAEPHHLWPRTSR